MIQTRPTIRRFDTSQPLGATAWCVAALLALALICLLHDRGYATAKGLDLAEAGRGLENKAVNESGVAAAAPVRLTGLALLLIAGGVCLATLPAQLRFRPDELAVLICAAILWAFASWTWSVERGTTARELIRVSVYAGVAASLACRFDLRRVCIILGTALAGSALASVAYEIVTGGFRFWQADYRLTGSLHSNMLAVQSAVVAIIAYAFAVRGNRHKALCYSIFVAAVAIVVLTKTRTSLLTIVAGMAVIHLAGRPLRDWLFNATACASLAAAGVIAATVLNLPVEKQLEKLITLGRGDEGDSTLTGRVPLWQFIWRETADRRFQGAGYGAFWLRERTENAHDALRWYPRHSHNAYLEVMANLGIVGLALVLVIALAALARAANLAAESNRPENFVVVALLAAAFVNAFTETAFVMPRDIGLAMGALVFSLALRPSWDELLAATTGSNTAPGRVPYVFGRRRNLPMPGSGNQWSES